MREIREPSYFAEQLARNGDPSLDPSREGVHKDLLAELNLQATRLATELREITRMIQNEGGRPLYRVISVPKDEGIQATPATTFKEFDEGIKPIRGASVDLDEDTMSKPVDTKPPPIHDPFDTTGYVDRIMERNRSHIHDWACSDIRDCK